MGQREISVFQSFEVPEHFCFGMEFVEDLMFQIAGSALQRLRNSTAEMFGSASNWLTVNGAASPRKSSIGIRRQQRSLFHPGLLQSWCRPRISDCTGVVRLAGRSTWLGPLPQKQVSKKTVWLTENPNRSSPATINVVNRCTLLAYQECLAVRGRRQQSSHVGQQCLGGTNIRRCLVAANVLFAGFASPSAAPFCPARRGRLQ